MNYSSAQLALEGWFADRWPFTLVSYQSQNIPLPDGRPLPTEAWLRFSVSGVGFATRSVGRGEPWRVWPYILQHQIFTPLHSGHDVADGYVNDLLLLWQDLDFCVPNTGARWLCIAPPLPPTARQEREWFQTNFTVPAALEWRG